MKGRFLDRIKEIPDSSVDMIMADPPYGTTQCRWDVVIPLKPMWEELLRVTKENGAIVLMGSQPFTSVLVCSNLKYFRYSLVWEKTTATGHLNAKRMPMRAHEDILVFYKKLPTYNPIKTTGHKKKISTAIHKRNSKETEVYNKHGLSSYNSTERYPRSIIKTSTDKQKSKLHPTQKPIALMEYLIKTYTNEGQMVLDFVSGSFTTTIAAINTGRDSIGIEKDEDYYKVGLKRVIEHVKGRDDVNVMSS